MIALPSIRSSAAPVGVKAPVLPEDLSPRQIEVLRFIATFKHVRKLRGAKGWGLAGHAPAFTNVILDKLLWKDLVRKELSRGHWTVHLTGSGQNILAALDARQALRKA